jgi:hypothetical protein
MMPSMDYLPVAMPQTESDLAVMVSLLEAHQIQYFVHNEGFGGLYPGLQIGLVNVRRIMVPAAQAAFAMELLSVFAPQPSTEVQRRLTILDKARILFETCFFGWSFPVKRQTIKNDNDAE